MEKREITKLKKRINSLLWEYAPDNITLKELETRAVEVLNLIMENPSKYKDTAEDKANKVKG